MTAVGYTYRRSPAIAAIRDHVRSGELGDLSVFHGRYWCDYDGLALAAGNLRAAAAQM